MAKLIKFWPKIAVVTFLAIMFFIGLVPLRDFDLWFHLASGQLILQKGIVRYDIFSYNTAGREWFPYEWLFQVAVALIQKWFGFEAIKYLTAAVLVVLSGFYLMILRKILKLQLLFSMLITFLFVVSIFEFVDARPHIVAYTFLIINLYLILNYFVRDKNLLWLTIPITLAWANEHGSVFIDILLFVAYAGVALIQLIISKSGGKPTKFGSSSTFMTSGLRKWLVTDSEDEPQFSLATTAAHQKTSRLRKFLILTFYTILTAILTVMPPLGTLQYRLLWYFYQNSRLLSRFIDEWTPLSGNAFAFNFYSGSLLLILLFFTFSLIKSKKFSQILIFIPILPFIVLPYSASRNIVLGYISLGIILAESLSLINFPKLSKIRKLAVIAVSAGLLVWHIDILTAKQTPVKLYYPVDAVQFLKRVHLNGHMFNEYGYGGYLLYNLYPDYRVFYDGRTDLYLPREMPDTLNLAVKKIQPDNIYQKTLTAFWNKYDISFVILTTQKHNLLRKISHILTLDPEWSLIYWDDYTQIFVRHDGQNDDVISRYGVSAATPYERDPYRTGLKDLALTEYTKMDSIVPSAHSKNAVGYLELTRGQFAEAKKEFEAAMPLDPSFESPLMNLAEIYAKNGDLDTAIALYQKAQQLAPDRGLIYIRLGELLLTKFNDRAKVREIWQEGVQNTVDTDAKKELQGLLTKLSH